ncbi:unnamed protein product [Larinioides sclopetarius]|uniref:Uncharacterized protein n=1 Tax=Larinioides sclopetarius TaxID=280406 RepID=A0AAV2BT39_9ARAC
MPVEPGRYRTGVFLWYSSHDIVIEEKVDYTMPCNDARTFHDSEFLCGFSPHLTKPDLTHTGGDGDHRQSRLQLKVIKSRKRR